MPIHKWRGKANSDKELSEWWRDQLQNYRDTSRECDTHDATSCNTGIGLEFGKACKVNHSVEKWMPALEICCCAYGSSGLSRLDRRAWRSGCLTPDKKTQNTHLKIKKKNKTGYALNRGLNGLPSRWEPFGEWKYGFPCLKLREISMAAHLSDS